MLRPEERERERGAGTIPAPAAGELAEAMEEAALEIEMEGICPHCSVPMMPYKSQVNSERGLVCPICGHRLRGLFVFIPRR